MRHISWSHAAHTQVHDSPVSLFLCKGPPALSALLSDCLAALCRCLSLCLLCLPSLSRIAQGAALILCLSMQTPGLMPSSDFQILALDRSVFSSCLPLSPCF